jgi:hypothetical protein
MAYDQNIVRTLYKRLIALYPGAFKEQLGESMEQTFNDLCNEKQQTKQALLGFVLRTFIETAMGIFREYLLLISSGVIMQTLLNTLGSTGLVSLLLIFPFMIMEVVNRRNFNEDFPFVLFLGLWLNMFALSLILLPIVRTIWTGKHEMANPVPTQRNTLHITAKSVAMISVVLVLSLVIVSLLDSQRLLNDPNSEQLSVFGVRVASQFIAFILLSIPVATGVIAGRPITTTLRDGGSLFAHPINLLIVVVISFFFAAGVGGLIADQMPCFLGVPNCD